MRRVLGVICSLASVIGVMAFALTAAAQKLPSAETGMVVFALESKTTMPAPLELDEGEVAWTETARPALVARLLDDVPERARPRKTAGISVGALLFGFKVTGGTAYCAPIDPDAHNGRVQCLRDLDNEGTFDAGYVSQSHQLGSHYTPNYVHALSAVPKARYEKVDHHLAPPIELAVVFRRTREGVPVFRVEFEGNRNVRDKACEALAEGGCAMMGRAVAYTLDDARGIALLAGARDEPYVVVLETEPFK